MHQYLRTVLALFAALHLQPALADPPPSEPPGPPELSTTPKVYAERMQVFYDPLRGEVERRRVKVLDPDPEARLDFTWEPDLETPVGVDDLGYASGRGTLVWRIPGTPSYDPRAFFSRYTGTLEVGAPEGRGRMTYRDGSYREGRWRDGQLSGAGVWLRPDGSRYEGNFLAGVPEGVGRLSSAEGWVYQGGFKAGLPQGIGTKIEPGRPNRAVVMEAGREVEGSYPELLPAQAGSQAERVRISVVANTRVALDQELLYHHYNDGSVLHLFPDWTSMGSYARRLSEMWDGGGNISDFGHPRSLSYVFQEYDLSKAYAFLDTSVATLDGTPVTLHGLDLVVDYSAPHLRPMLVVDGATRCFGHRPDFYFLNFGFGPVEGPRLRVQFVPHTTSMPRTDPSGPNSDWANVPIPNFDQGLTVNVSSVLRQLGVDVDTLAGNRFHCASDAELPACFNNLVNHLELGQLKHLIYAGASDRAMTADLYGDLTYHWTDAWGTRHEVNEQFKTLIVLAELETSEDAREMGAGGSLEVVAPQYQPVRLPSFSQGERIPVLLRGSPHITQRMTHLHLSAEQSSIHSLRFEARLGDGSVQSSMPMLLYFLSPRKTGFNPQQHWKKEDWQSCPLSPDR